MSSKSKKQNPKAVRGPYGRPQSFFSERPLRYPRRFTAHLLQKSLASIRRMEKAGVLDPIRD